MPETVRIEFPPPQEEGIVALRILEAPTSTGTWVEIERTVDVGAYPDYIDSYTTTEATSKSDWFAIQWEFDAGVLSELSNPIKGETENVVSKVANYVTLADPSIDEGIAFQEAAAVVEAYFGKDPFDPSIVASYKQLSGLSLLATARAYLRLAGAQGGLQSFTAGLVSVKHSGTDSKTIDYLLKEAGRMLGITTSRVAQLCMPEVAGGLAEIVEADISRLLIDVA